MSRLSTLRNVHYLRFHCTCYIVVIGLIVAYIQVLSEALFACQAEKLANGGPCGFMDCNKNATNFIKSQDANE